jgi:hypothetical protein
MMATKRTNAQRPNQILIIEKLLALRTLSPATNVITRGIRIHKRLDPRRNETTKPRHQQNRKRGRPEEEPQGNTIYPTKLWLANGFNLLKLLWLASTITTTGAVRTRASPGGHSQQPSKQRQEENPTKYRHKPPQRKQNAFIHHCRAIALAASTEKCKKK